MSWAILFPVVCGIAALCFVGYLVKDILAKPRGNDLMVEISDAVQEGAKAFLVKEYTYIVGFVAVIFGLFFLAGNFTGGAADKEVAAAVESVEGEAEAEAEAGAADEAAPAEATEAEAAGATEAEADDAVVTSEEAAEEALAALSWRTGLAFVLGAFASSLAGFIGMSIATRANSRTAQAAVDGGMHSALAVAISGGGVMGMSVVGISVLGLCIVYYAAQGDVAIVNGYAMGASLVALFARSGGGIFTKGADMGADLVGKVEAGIPEDDPRNAATIADNVGDNVGDVAGLGADLLESFVASMIAAIAISSSGLDFSALDDPDAARNAMNMLPLMIAGVGMIASMGGIMFIRASQGKDAQKALMRGTYVAAAGTMALTGLVVWIFGRPYVEDGETYSKMGIFLTTVIGIVAGGIIGFTSEMYTSSHYSPTKKIAENSESGPALTVTSGLSVGMASCGIPAIVLAVSIVLAFSFAGFYGVALAALGMLATTGIIVSVDSYGPIADNAGGIAEMAHLDPSIRKITDNLDSVGNTTAAIGKGFAIGSAAFAAMGLIVAYTKVAGIETAKINDPEVLAGLLLGGMFPFYFSSTLFDAVTKAAYKMIAEVRRQLKEKPGIMEGTEKPDYRQCVAIATTGAINGMLLPGLLAIVLPFAVGYFWSKEALLGLLVGALITGLMLGIQMANSGGAMDNAKKYIEEGHHGGKGSDAHKAAVVGDTVGDPLKDTVGPSINILIKLMCVISLVFAPMFA